MPTNQKGAEQSVATANKALSPAILEANKKRAELVRKLHARHKAYLDGVAKGEIDPHADFAAALPGVEAKLPAIRRDYVAFLADRDDADLRHKLFIALQPIGDFLADADYQDCDLSLTKTQVDEIKAYQKAEKKPDDGTASRLAIEGPTAVTTLIHLPTPIRITGPAGATVYLESHGGGAFENGLPVIATKTNDKGSALVHWRSPGDSIGYTHVSLKSPDTNNSLVFEIRVAQLTPKPLPTKRRAPKKPNTTP